MEITASPLDWASNDEENWARFLETETGKRVIPKLASLAPPLLEEGDKTKILIRSGVVRGFQLVITELLSMAHPAPANLQEGFQPLYAPLEDDRHWEGAKLSDPPEAEFQIPEEHQMQPPHTPTDNPEIK